jgi:hypothetical protein
MYMVMFVLDNLDLLDAILDAWEKSASAELRLWKAPVSTADGDRSSQCAICSNRPAASKRAITPCLQLSNLMRLFRHACSYRTVGGRPGRTEYRRLFRLASDCGKGLACGTGVRIMAGLTVWIQFLLSAAIIVLAANQLAKYGDVIALRTGLGGMFVGILLMAGATSLPEVLTTISSLNQGVPDLAAGNLFGSNMFNMFLLAILDLLHRKERLLRKAALKHALSGSLAVFLIAIVVFFVMADIRCFDRLGWDRQPVHTPGIRDRSAPDPEEYPAWQRSSWQGRDSRKCSWPEKRAVGIQHRSHRTDLHNSGHGAQQCHHC